MGINKVQYGNQTLIDLTNDTVTASTLLEGITAHDRSGTLITGTLPTPSLQTKTKTYTPSTSQQTESITADNGYDGLSAVNVTVNAMPTMTLPISTDSLAVGSEQARIFPSTSATTYLNIPSGYNATNRYYSLRPLMVDSKTITENGTYVASDDDLDGFSSVTVNVSGGSSEVAVNASTGYSSGGSDLIFYDLLGEPTSFVIFCVDPTTLSTGASPYKTAAVVYDGVNDKVQYITNTSNAQMTYEGPGAYHFYSNGQLVVTCMDSQFVSGQYGMYYTYGGGAGNIGTSLVQVGSGVTSIQFTNLPDEPIYWSCMFTGNIGTSSGYTRAHIVASADNYIVGREMGSASTFSNEHWSATYNNGTLTISSQSTSAGGYFHQPGYYQLTYAIAGDGQITTEPLSVTQNGTYTAPFGTAYTPVTVNVTPTLQTKNKTYTPTTSQQSETITADSGYDGLSAVNVTVSGDANLVAGNIKSGTSIFGVTGTYSGGGDGKNAQIASGVGRVAATSYTAVSGQSLTVSKTGTYDVYWVGYRSSTSGTNGSQLYIGSTAYGSAQTTFNSSYTNVQNVHLSNVSLTANQTITVRARSRGTSYYMYVMNLTIIEV